MSLVQTHVWSEHPVRIGDRFVRVRSVRWVDGGGVVVEVVGNYCMRFFWLVLVLDGNRRQSESFIQSVYVGILNHNVL